jgi:hypothetical protein
MVSVPSDTVIVVEPLRFKPSPIDVAVKIPVEAGEVLVRTSSDPGATTTIDVSLLTAVIVPLKPLSVMVSCCDPLIPPKATAAGLALSGIGVGDGVGVGVGLAVAVGVADAPADAEAPGEALAALLAEVDGTDFEPPPPPHPTNTARAATPKNSAVLRITSLRGSAVRFPCFSCPLRSTTQGPKRYVQAAA